MFFVQYRCQYRDYWYDDWGPVEWEQAVRRAQQLYTANRGTRPVRVVGEYDTVFYSLPLPPT